MPGRERKLLIHEELARVRVGHLRRNSDAGHGLPGALVLRPWLVRSLDGEVAIFQRGARRRSKCKLNLHIPDAVLVADEALDLLFQGVVILAEVNALARQGLQIITSRSKADLCDVVAITEG